MPLRVSAALWAGRLALGLLPCAAAASPGPGSAAPLLELVRIEPGSFIMGCTPAQEARCFDSERPAHQVTITRAFGMARTELTQGQAAALGLLAEIEDSPQHPLHSVSWQRALEIANALSEREGLEPCYLLGGPEARWPQGLDCEGYRLPTEAEWEYAARAGRDSLYAGGSELEPLGWSRQSSGGSSQPAGTKAPNDWGLYDLSGSLLEWVWGGLSPYPEAPQVDPLGLLDEASGRVSRGGCYRLDDSWLRVSRRLRYEPSSGQPVHGLRLVRTLP